MLRFTLVFPFLDDLGEVDRTLAKAIADVGANTSECVFTRKLTQAIGYEVVTESDTSFDHIKNRFVKRFGPRVSVNRVPDPMETPTISTSQPLHS